MSRTRTLGDLAGDAYRRADMENATDRHPTSDVYRYINQGAAELRDILIATRGPEFFSNSANITTTANTTSYSLETDFLALVSVRLAGTYSAPLEPWDSQEEPMLRSPEQSIGLPTHYQLQRSSAGTNTIEVLPNHAAGLTITYRYVPVYADMANSGNTLDGVDGWEEYPVVFAARCMAVKDELWELAGALERDMGRLKERIQSVATKRNMHRARRVRDVRGANMLGFRGRRYW